jgi:argininosuccinate lyase
LAQDQDTINQADTADKGETLFTEDVYEAIKLENVVGRRRTYGGTSPEQVRAAVIRLKDYLAEGQEK